MPQLPLIFGANSWSYLDKTSLSYTFDIVTSMTFDDSVTSLHFQQDTGYDNTLSAIAISIEGRSANPNVSLSLNGVTYLYNIQQLYICSHSPILNSNSTASSLMYSIVIECYSNLDVQNKKLLIFLPLDTDQKTSTDNGLDNFNILYSNIVDSTTNVIVDSYNSSVTGTTTVTKTIRDTNFDINELMPNTTYYVYQSNDTNGVNYNVIFFDETSLSTNSKIKNYFDLKFSDSTSNYNNRTSKSYEIASNNFLLYKSTQNPNKQIAIDSTFEENIYIDCQPVDIPNQDTTSYFQKIDGDYVHMGFVYLFTIVFISVLVYAIYNLKNLFKNTTEMQIDKINETLTQFTRYVK